MMAPTATPIHISEKVTHHDHLSHLSFFAVQGLSDSLERKRQSDPRIHQTTSMTMSLTAQFPAQRTTRQRFFLLRNQHSAPVAVVVRTARNRMAKMRQTRDGILTGRVGEPRLDGWRRLPDRRRRTRCRRKERFAQRRGRTRNALTGGERR